MNPAEGRPVAGLVIGPTEGAPDVQVVVERPVSGSRAQPSPQGKGPDGADRGPGYAHVNIWRLNAAGAAGDDSAARVVGAELERQPGFQSYMVVRTGEREVVAVTVFETEDQLRAAMDAVAPLVGRHVHQLVEPGPERRAGPLLHYRAA